MLGVNGNIHSWMTGGIQVFKWKGLSLQLTLDHCKQITTLDAHTPQEFEAASNFCWLPTAYSLQGKGALAPVLC